MVRSVSSEEIRFVVVELDLAEIWDGVLAFSKDTMTGGTAIPVQADADGPVLYKPDGIGVFKRWRYGWTKPCYISLRLYGLTYTTCRNQYDQNNREIKFTHCFLFISKLHWANGLYIFQVLWPAGYLADPGIPLFHPGTS
jgi:hypothetical protein